MINVIFVFSSTRDQRYMLFPWLYVSFFKQINLFALHFKYKSNFLQSWGVPNMSNMIKTIRIRSRFFHSGWVCSGVSYWNSSSEESKRVFSLLVTFVDSFGMIDLANPELPDVLGMVTVAWGLMIGFGLSEAGSSVQTSPYELFRVWRFPAKTENSNIEKG